MKKFCLLLLFFVVGYTVAEANRLSQPHQLTDNSADSLCQQCHVGDIRSRQMADASADRMQPLVFKRDEISMCSRCHEDNSSSHQVDIKVDFPVPADLPLSASGHMTCLTCHKAHGRLRSDRPWASVNFMDRLLNSESLTKTYLLRRNNAEGELCLVCHDHEEKHNYE